MTLASPLPSAWVRQQRVSWGYQGHRGLEEPTHRPAPSPRGLMRVVPCSLGPKDASSREWVREPRQPLAWPQSPARQGGAGSRDVRAATQTPGGHRPPSDVSGKRGPRPTRASAGHLCGWCHERDSQMSAVPSAIRTLPTGSVRRTVGKSRPQGGNTVQPEVPRTLESRRPDSAARRWTARRGRLCTVCAGLCQQDGHPPRFAADVHGG